VVAGTVVLIPHAPLGSLPWRTGHVRSDAAQHVDFVLLMANDREALGPWVNARWLNAVAVVIIAILVVLSVVMMVSTLFTSVNVVAMLEWWAPSWDSAYSSVCPLDYAVKDRALITTSTASTGACRDWPCGTTEAFAGAPLALDRNWDLFERCGNVAGRAIIQLATS